MRIDFKPLPDALSLLTSGGGVGLIGTAAKKTLIRPDDGLGKTFMVGLLATLASGGAGFWPFLLASPGLEARADLQAARADAVDRKF